MEITPQKEPAPKLEKLIQNGDFVEHNSIGAAFHRGPSRRSGLKLTAYLLASVITDLMIILGCTLFFVVGVSQVFRAVDNPEMTQFMNSFLNQKALKETLFYLFGYISIIYFIFLRVYLGSTIGEWSCGIRVGQPNERMKSGYAFKVIFRVLLITCTGVFTLPLLSLLFKKDIAGLITKASLYTLK